MVSSHEFSWILSLRCLCDIQGEKNVDREITLANCGHTDSN